MPEALIAGSRGQDGPGMPLGKRRVSQRWRVRNSRQSASLEPTGAARPASGTGASCRRLEEPHRLPEFLIPFLLEGEVSPYSIPPMPN